MYVWVSLCFTLPLLPRSLPPVNPLLVVSSDCLCERGIKKDGHWRTKCMLFFSSTTAAASLYIYTYLPIYLSIPCLPTFEMNAPLLVLRALPFFFSLSSFLSLIVHAMFIVDGRLRWDWCITHTHTYIYIHIRILPVYIHLHTFSAQKGRERYDSAHRLVFLLLLLFLSILCRHARTQCVHRFSQS